MSVFFCWLCEKPVEDRDGRMDGDARRDTHYEHGGYLYFCCHEHWDTYNTLKAL